jgi:dTDP-4-dehydrorhamnose reductase
MRVSVIGGTGLLGQAIRAQWRQDDLVLAGSRDVDIREPRQVKDFLARHRSDWVVLAAAISQPDDCERNPELAEQINHEGAIHVAEACREHGARLMFLSSDYVFDGSKQSPYEVNDAVNPVNVYGRTKAAAEKDLQALLPGCCIARISWLFGAEKKCFANTVLAKAESGQPVRVRDQISVPNYNHDVAHALASLARAGARGIVHVTNAGVASRHEFASALLRAAGFMVEVSDAMGSDLTAPAPRPSYSALSDASLRSFGIQLRHWREAVSDYLARRCSLASARG